MFFQENININVAAKAFSHDFKKTPSKMFTLAERQVMFMLSYVQVQILTCNYCLMSL